MLPVLDEDTTTKQNLTLQPCCFQANSHTVHKGNMKNSENWDPWSLSLVNFPPVPTIATKNFGEAHFARNELPDSQVLE